MEEERAREMVCSKELFFNNNKSSFYSGKCHHTPLPLPHTRKIVFCCCVCEKWRVCVREGEEEVCVCVLGNYATSCVCEVGRKKWCVSGRCVCVCVEVVVRRES